MSSPEFKFDYGENVFVVRDAPSELRPSQDAWVCSMRVVDDEAQASAINYPIGTVLYLIEYRDGSDVEVPEKYLEHIED